MLILPSEYLILKVWVWGPIICIANKFLGKATTQGTTVRASPPGVILTPRGHMVMSRVFFFLIFYGHMVSLVLAMYLGVELLDNIVTLS